MTLPKQHAGSRGVPEHPAPASGLRPGEKVGWLGGWAGSFLWVPVLGVLFLFRGQVTEAVVGFLLAGIGFGMAVAARPWHHPDTPYWRLMLLPVMMIVASVFWVIWSFGAEAAGALRWWHGLLLLPILSPFVTIGRRRWRDG